MFFVAVVILSFCRYYSLRGNVFAFNTAFIFIVGSEILF
jgi:hypothetical protein